MHSRDVMLLQNNISRNYHYCDQDDTFPWVCVLKYVSNSNRCHRHLVFYIFDVQKFPYLSKYKYQQSYSNYVKDERKQNNRKYTTDHGHLAQRAINRGICYQQYDQHDHDYHCHGGHYLHPQSNFHQGLMKIFFQSDYPGLWWKRPNFVQFFTLASGVNIDSTIVVAHFYIFWN